MILYFYNYKQIFLRTKPTNTVSLLKERYFSSLRTACACSEENAKKKKINGDFDKFFQYPTKNNNKKKSYVF